MQPVPRLEEKPEGNAVAGEAGAAQIMTLRRRNRRQERRVSLRFVVAARAHESHPFVRSRDLRAATIRAIFRHFVRWLGANALLLSFCTIAAAGSAIAFSTMQEKRYEAVAVVNYRDAAFYFRLIESSPVEPTQELLLAVENAGLSSLDAVEARVTGRLDVDEDLIRAVDVKPQANSDLIDIEADAEAPEQAASIANEYADSYVTVRRFLDRAQANDLIPLIRDLRSDLSRDEDSGPVGEQLVSEIEQLQFLAERDTGNEFVASEAEVPTDPAEPQVARNAGVAAGLGLITGLCFALLRRRESSAPEANAAH